MIHKLLSFLLILVLFVIFTNNSALAQTSQKDSILNAIKIKRSIDSIARVELKVKLQKQKDSLQLAIKLKRTADSLGRVALVQERINERKKQDSIATFKKNFIKDSIDASKNGITIRLGDLIQEKENEKIRLKKLEEKIAKQRIEDSTLFAIKTLQEIALKRIQDSIATENKKIEEAKQKAIIAEQKRIQDSITIAKQLEEEQNRIKQEKIIAEQKRIQDSITVAKQFEEEQNRIKQEKIIAEQKRIQDSIIIAKQLEVEQNRIKQKKMIAEQKRIQDSITVAKQFEEEQNRIKQEKIIAEQKRIQDSITIAKQFEEEQIRIKQEKIIAEQKRLEDSITIAKQFEEEQNRIKQEKLIAEQKRLEDSILIAKKVKEDLLKTEQELLYAKQKKYNDSLLIAQDSIKLLNKIASEKLAIEQKKYNDSIAIAQQKKIEEDKILFAQLSAQQKRYNDSLKIMQDLEREKNNTILARYYANTDTNLFSKIDLQKIKDSLETVERIRLQELKYAKQRIEDSLYLVSLQKIDSIKKIVVLKQDTTINIDTISKNEVVKMDSIIITSDTLLAKRDSIFYKEVALQKKQTIISFNFGLSNYLGDLGGNSGVGRKFFYDNNFKKRTYMYGVSLTKVWREVIGLRLSYQAGKIAGSDNDVEYKDQNDNAYFRYKRNLDFTTKISEWSAIFEINPLKFVNRNNIFFKSSLQPYVLAGIGKFKFNPQGSYFDEISQDYVLVHLAPLKTEGQGMAEYPNRKPYKLSQTNIPFGFGINYHLGTKTSMAFEFVGRKLYTDYLDDVSTTFVDPSIYNNYFSGEDLEIAQTMTNKSNLIDPNNPYGIGEQRGNSKNNDFYYSFNVKLNIQINKMKRNK